MLICDVCLYGPEGETLRDRKNGMMYDLCVMCVMLYVLCFILLWAGRQNTMGRKAIYTGRKAICYGPEGDYITGRKAMLCGLKGPGRKAYVGKSYTGELTKHLCLLVVFMFFRY